MEDVFVIAPGHKVSGATCVFLLWCVIPDARVLDIGLAGLLVRRLPCVGKEASQYLLVLTRARPTPCFTVLIK